MTFNPKKTADVRMVHYTPSSAATINTGEKIIFDTKSVSTSGDGVSVDESGNFSFNEKCSYYMILSCDINRSSTSHSFEITMRKTSDASTALTPNEGASKIDYNRNNLIMSNFSLIGTLKNPTEDYFFHYSGNSAIINTDMDLLILEFY